MLPFFDASVLAPEISLGSDPPVPEGLEGALFHGGNAKPVRDELQRWQPGKLWRHAEVLDRIVGETHASFPSRSAGLVDLKMPEEDLQLWLKSPSEWWPLCESLRNSKRYLRIHLPPGPSCVSMLKQVVKRFRQTHFWIDPFVHGPEPGWQGHVRLAEYENLWLSTQGLYPADGGKWNKADARDAVEFVVGEVGASKLIYASGLSWEALASGFDRPQREWIESLPALEEAERSLVLQRNAHVFLFTPPETEELL